MALRDEHGWHYEMGLRAGADSLDGVRRTLGSLGEPAASAHVPVGAAVTLQHDSSARASSQSMNGGARGRLAGPQGTENEVTHTPPPPPAWSSHV